MAIRKFRIEDFYDFHPDPRFAPGDIWSDLPSFGVLQSRRVCGIVITPSCDLANSKTETISYLPLVPIASYFAIPAGASTIRHTCQELCSDVYLAGFRSSFEWQQLPPAADSLGQAAEEIRILLEKPGIGNKNQQKLSRLAAGVRVLLCSHRTDGRLPSADVQDLRTLFGKEWRDISRKIFTNSHSHFIHFLPCDKQQSDISGVLGHSVVLFRYPFTLPVEILYRANEVGVADWQSELSGLSSFFPIAGSLAGLRPLKRLSVRKPYMSDLLNRYIAVYGRIGSPDLALSTIARFTSEIGYPV